MLKKFDFIKGKVREYIKFNIVGMSNFAVSQLIYITLYLLFKINYIVSYTITTVFSVCVSYFFNSKFTFKQEKYSLSKFLLTILIYICEYLINMTAILFLVNIIGLNKIIAPIIAPVFSTIPVFFLMRFVIKVNK
ncbi:MAG: GtrA family protein [Clostridium sp.]|nr:GtrA family protein [Clostridium sp.]